MAVNTKYQSVVSEKTEGGTTYKETFYGTKAEMEELRDSLEMGVSTDYGYRRRATVTQSAGAIYECAVEYSSTANDSNVVGPSDEFDKVSCTLDTGVMSVPLETLSGYLTNWNYYLITCSTTGEDEIPDFWENAKTTIIEDPYKGYYKWVKNISDIPTEINAETGVPWEIVKEPTKPGVESVDRITAVVTETCYFRTDKQAASYVGGRLNKIKTAYPADTFGITEGNWKCDRATVNWNGKKWVATLTYTHSGDAKGWDKDLYEEAT